MTKWFIAGLAVFVCLAVFVVVVHLLAAVFVTVLEIAIPSFVLGLAGGYILGRR